MGDQLIICLDANDNMKDGEVASAFKSKGLQEVNKKL